MNVRNLDLAIQVMKRAEARNSVYMCDWQSGPSGASRTQDSEGSPPTVKYRIAGNEEEFHACGNRACLVGHLAVAPEIQAIGGTAGRDGDMVFDGAGGPYGLSLLLQIPHGLARLFVFGDLRDNFLFTEPRISRFYFGTPWEQVTATHVLKRLYELKEKGPAQMLKEYWDAEGMSGSLEKRYEP